MWQLQNSLWQKKTATLRQTAWSLFLASSMCLKHTHSHCSHAWFAQQTALCGRLQRCNINDLEQLTNIESCKRWKCCRYFGQHMMKKHSLSSRSLKGITSLRTVKNSRKMTRTGEHHKMRIIWCGCRSFHSPIITRGKRHQQKELDFQLILIVPTPLHERIWSCIMFAIQQIKNTDNGTMWWSHKNL
jgi:hypothetical protein